MAPFLPLPALLATCLSPLRAWAAVAWLLAAAAALPAAAAAPPLQLRIVGGLADLSQYTRHEEPFWRQRLSALTGGRVQADIMPFDRAGIRGQDMLRLLQLGVVPFGTAILGVSMTADPLVGMLDLPGAHPDLATLRQSVAAFRPALAAHLRQTQGVELLAVYTYSAQVLFCRQAFSGLGDLAGRRVRVSSAPQADFIEALGGVPVLSPFAELLPRLRAGQLDCAITGTMSGNSIGLHEATSHLHMLPIAWGLSLFAANKGAWASLPADLRQLLLRELPLLEQAVWADAERETAQGNACNTGSDACKAGQRGQMVGIPASTADQTRLRQALAGTVLPRWAQRCGPRCSEAWDSGMAPLLGLPLQPAAR